MQRVMIFKGFVLSIALLCECAFGKTNCKVVEQTAVKSAARINGAESGFKVIGKGRLQFLSAPDRNCQISGLFMMPGQNVNAYMVSGEFVSVLYINLKTSDEVEGWVLLDRLARNGYGISPKEARSGQ